MGLNKNDIRNIIVLRHDDEHMAKIILSALYFELFGEIPWGFLTEVEEEKVKQFIERFRDESNRTK
jgi:hypothetical protein